MYYSVKLKSYSDINGLSPKLGHLEASQCNF